MKSLNDIPKQNNFKTPEGYFDSLDKKIAEKIKNNEENKPKSAFEIFKPYIYMAASLIILASAVKFGLNVLVDKDPVVKPDIETIASTESNYFLDEFYDDDIAFYEYLSEEEEVYASNDISDEEIENYLSQYYIEYELQYE
ncbi:MAG: hypothetical protein JXR36_10010 [Bacteroidales bacterium]|nr:hypothetical protein [Bacteroidales bacterium]